MDTKQRILDAIKRNPYISQKELADMIGLSRPAVANYISQLTKSGEIKGRAYILNEQKSIICIGGANVDRKLISYDPVKSESSNPVQSSEALGGVARNVAENLVRLGKSSALLSVVGRDPEGERLLESSNQLGIDTGLTTMLQNERTGTYTAPLNPDGEMVVGMADMAIYDQVTDELLNEKWGQLKSAEAIFVDTNITSEALEYLVRQCADYSIPLYVDPVSSSKAAKLPSDLSGIQTIFPNREEVEVLSGVKVNGKGDLTKACRVIHAKGVKELIVTLGEQGIYYSNQEVTGNIKPVPTTVVDVTGAGDALAASYIFGKINGEKSLDACQLGLAGAALALASTQAVSPEISAKKLYEMGFSK